MSLSELILEAKSATEQSFTGLPAGFEGFDRQGALPPTDQPPEHRYSDQLRRGEELTFGGVGPGQSRRAYTLTDEPPMHAKSRAIPVATVVAHPAEGVAAVRRLVRIRPKVRHEGQMRDWAVLLIWSPDPGRDEVVVDALLPDNAAADVSKGSRQLGRMVVALEHP